MTEKKTGYVKWFDARKGYGFITMNSVDVQDEIFVHFSNINMEGFKKLETGDEVEFEIKDSKEDKGPEALNVRIISKDRRY
ncbi:MAG: cold shock domain-containing protein [Promethearchaeota archaeon]